MRRADREITDAAQIEAFIAQQQIMRVAFYENGEIYIVPVNYGYCRENGAYRFYFHGAAAGRKYTLACDAPAVGFEIDGNYAVTESDKACGYSASFQSVIGTGRLCVVEDAAEREAGLRCLMRQVSGNDAWEFDTAVLNCTAVFRLDVKTMSCKAKA